MVDANKAPHDGHGATGTSGMDKSAQAGAFVPASQAPGLLAQSPGERVRFVAAATLRVEGREGVWPGSVLNLSTCGASIATEVPMEPGDRIRLAFRINLSEAPLSCLCDVIWAERGQRGCGVYGVSFADSLRPEAAARVRDAVQERTEGRAGEWPLPLLPSGHGLPREVPRSNGRWSSGAIGMAAGIGLSLLLLALSQGMETPLGLRAAAPAEVSRPEPEPEPEPAAQVLSEAPAADLAQAEASPATSNAASENVSSSSPSRIPSGDPPGGSSGERRGIVIVGDRNMATLHLPTDGDIDKYTTFWLRQPTRLVIDVYGRRSGVDAAATVPSHPLVQRLRVGQHDGKVRFVVETIDAVAAAVDVLPQGPVLLVTLRRK